MMTIFLDKLKKNAVFEKKIRGLQRNLEFQYFLQHFSQTIKTFEELYNVIIAHNTYYVVTFIQ